MSAPGRADTNPQVPPNSFIVIDTAPAVVISDQIAIYLSPTLQIADIPVSVSAALHSCLSSLGDTLRRIIGFAKPIFREILFAFFLTSPI